MNNGRTRRDLSILFGARFARAVAFGFSAVIFALYLQDLHFSAIDIGVLLATSFAAVSITSLAAAYAQSKFGRRRTLAATGGLMAICGAVLVFGSDFPWLLLAALTGMVGAAGTDSGPFLPVEQTVLTEATTPIGRNRAFGRYSFIGAVAGTAGGLVAAFGSSLGRMQALFALFAGIGLITAVLPLLLSDAVEGESGGPVFGNVRPLIGLAALFGIDSFGGGLVARSVLAYWLHIRYGATVEVLGPTFAAMQLLGALFFELAGRLADRIGLINTMVFTHFPSNLLLLLFPFLPSLPVAIALLIVWSAAESMDVPARQAYIVSIVPPSERTGAGALTGVVRGLASAFGPAITGAAIQSAALGTPFFVAGTTKALYDVALYVGFRRRKAEHEVTRSQPDSSDLAK